jgi:hypothetical protein
MTYNVMERMVRQRLREKRGQVYCADCLAMAELAGRQTFIAGGCPCGGTGLGYRW